MTTIQLACSVCSEPLTTHTEAYCGSCGEPYHLNQRIDLEGKDCGQVWINEEHLGLEFACNPCLTPPPPASLDDILDLEEAALALGTTATALAAAADEGHIRHRRTGAGTYLFQRAELDAYLRGPGR